MDGVMYAQMSPADRQAVRKEMLRQAEEALKGIYPTLARRKAAAKSMVDMALAAEKRKQAA